MERFRRGTEGGGAALETAARLPISQKLYLGLSSTGSNMLSTIVGGAVLTWYLDFLHLAPTAIGTVFLIYGIWNAVNDPLFGLWSDRRRASPGGGKRLHFLRLALPLFALGFSLFWLPTAAWSQTALFANLLLSLFFFDTAFTMYVLNQNAIQAAMTTDTNERASLSLWCTVVSILPVAVARFAPTWLLTADRPRALVIGAFLATGALGLLAMGIASARIRERPEPAGAEKPLAILPALKATFSSRSFLAFVIYSFAMGGVAMASASVVIPYLKYVFGLEGSAALLPVLAGGVAQVAAYPAIYAANRRFGLKATLAGGILLAVLGYGVMAVATGLPLMIAAFACTQIGAGCHWLLFNAVVGDIADEDELATGRRREGAFFGVNALVVAPAQSIIFAAFTWIIDAFGYTKAFGAASGLADAATVARAALGIRIGSAAVPCLFLVVGLVALAFYPLAGERQARLKRDIAALHEARDNSFAAAASQGGEEP